jgi:hypothetical protein
MSTRAEQLETIKHAVEVAKRELNKLKIIQECSKITRAQEFEIDMHKECIRRGEALLKENK